MSIFKQSEPEDDFSDTEGEGRRIVSKRARLSREQDPDLERSGKGKLRVKKKEPPRPWTRKDRYLIIYILLFTIVTSAVLGLSAREWKLPGLPRLTLPTLSFLKGETIIIEGQDKLEKSKMKTRSETILTEYKEATKDLSGVYGLYVVDLTSGYSFGIAENEEFTAASLIKLPVIAGMYQLEETGGIKLDEKYILKGSDKIAGAGSLQLKPAGYEITYRNLLELMGKQSDNTAFGICRRALGDGEIAEIIKKIGMISTHLEDNTSSPRDIGTYFEGLWKGNIVSNDNRDKILDSLTDTIYEEWIKAGVPDEVRVAHKYGREVHVVNDAGITYSESPYVVVIMTKGVVEREADTIFPQLAKIVYKGMTKEVN